MHATHTLLDRMNPQARFRDRADDYARYRPSYPLVAIDPLFAELTLPSIITERSFT